ncbi:DUF2207 domain-containing protein [Neolewinella agarilytica]|uniref:DUF2207 domain-containing protein n=1 Tax=Neolewinella agarilytica TaxID=478744 RepID=UPI002352E740|nr:DUF2207 domain-containing protein [Neolewinella agarilytica]
MRYYFSLLIGLLFFQLNAQQEAIRSFSAELTVQTDGSVLVDETITVYADGKEIKRGITRALHRRPIGEDAATNRFDYEVLSVTRDGSDESYHTKSENGYRVIYVGKKDVILDPGTYTYTVRYRSDHQVYFLEGIDEIRWPLIGTDGRLPVEEASMTINFPSGTELINSSCYTGGDGSRESDCTVSRGLSSVEFRSDRSLAVGEGMLVSTGAPKGTIMRPVPPPPPSPLQQKGSLWASIFGLFLSLYYGYTTWKKYGVDPVAEDPGLQFAPPEGLSPASVAYLHSGYPGQAQLTASITALAIAGYLDIVEEERSGFFSSKEIFILRPTDLVPQPGSLPPEQQVLYDQLLDIGGDIELNGEYNEELNAATTSHNESLSDQHGAFLKEKSNGKKILPLLGIFIATAVLGGLFLPYSPKLGVVVFVITMFLLTIGTGLFAWLIRLPTLEKVTLRAKIKGLNNYLRLSEKKRKQLYNAPEMNQEHFEALLPYAIALGRENNWAADLSADWADSSQRETNRNMPWLFAGFGTSMGTAYSGTAHHAASAGGGGGSSFSGGAGSVGGGGGTGGW